MGDRQNTQKESICTVRSSPVVENVLHRQAIVDAAAAITAAHTANPEAGAWTTALRAQMLLTAQELTDLVTAIDA